MSVLKLEQQLKDAKEGVELYQALERLSKNRDFKRIVLEGFCEADAARCIRLSVDPTLDETTREDAIRMAQAAGYLKRHMRAIDQMGQMYLNSIPELEDALHEARVEEDLSQEDVD